ncbi:hypothetical protein Mapa_010504 [Marchantia paleacea]|nr:hypothetical protein Mapa_010504 [Marchantia paleacea]
MRPPLLIPYQVLPSCTPHEEAILPNPDRQTMRYPVAPRDSTAKANLDKHQFHTLHRRISTTSYTTEETKRLFTDLSTRTSRASQEEEEELQLCTGTRERRYEIERSRTLPPSFLTHSHSPHHLCLFSPFLPRLHHRVETFCAYTVFRPCLISPSPVVSYEKVHTIDDKTGVAVHCLPRPSRLVSTLRCAKLRSTILHYANQPVAGRRGRSSAPACLPAFPAAAPAANPRTWRRPKPDDVLDNTACCCSSSSIPCA